jgi:hypothetical protein
MRMILILFIAGRDWDGNRPFQGGSYRPFQEVFERGIISTVAKTPSPDRKRKIRIVLIDIKRVDD